MTWQIPKSERLMALAKQYIPGGVNSPVRSFRAVGGTPPFMVRGAGARLFDADGNSYVDYVLSWGPLVLGHAHPAVVAALQEAVRRGTSFGTPTELEVELARLITTALPAIDLVRMVNSGTEATMSAIRLARAFTGRAKVVKFAGCYHGHHDALLVEAGSGALTLGVPDSPGVTPATTADTLIAPFNDLGALQELFQQVGAEIACVIVEPVPGNMGLVLPEEGFLAGLRQLTAQYDSLLIFDEVMTGWRVAPGGAQTRFGIRPDLTTLGKVIGGGLPVAAYGGRAEIMAMVAPLGAVYQAGTLSGNPLAMTAGITTLQELARPGVWQALEANTKRLVDGLNATLQQLDLPYRARGIGSMWGLFFTEQEVVDYAGARTADVGRYARFFHGLLRRGHYVAPAQFEAGFLSCAHSAADIDSTLDAAAAALAEAAAS